MTKSYADPGRLDEIRSVLEGDPDLAFSFNSFKSYINKMLETGRNPSKMDLEQDGYGTLLTYASINELKALAGRKDLVRQPTKEMK